MVVKLQDDTDFRKKWVRDDKRMMPFILTGVSCFYL
jgi:hypothetical protein